MSFFCRGSIAGALLVLIPGLAQASVIAYTNEELFPTAGLGISHQVDFIGLVPPDGDLIIDAPEVSGPRTLSRSPAGFPDLSVRFSIDHASDGKLFVVGPSSDFYSVAVLMSQQSTTDRDNIRIELPTSVYAVAFNIGDYLGASLSVTLSNGDVALVSTAGYPTLQFVGLVSTDPFDSLLLENGPGDSINLASVLWLQPQPVPEPSGLAMAAIGGLVCLLGSRARFRRLSVPSNAA